MPRKKRSPLPSLPEALAPENLPVQEAHHIQVFHFEHLFALGAAFIFIFASLLSISSASRAQEFKAQVSATVLPIDSYSNYRLDQMNPFERFWSRLSPSEKMMYASAGGLAVVIIPLGLVLLRQQRKHHSQATA